MKYIGCEIGYYSYITNVIQQKFIKYNYNLIYRYQYYFILSIFSIKRLKEIGIDKLGQYFCNRAKQICCAVWRPLQAYTGIFLLFCRLYLKHLTIIINFTLFHIYLPYINILQHWNVPSLAHPWTSCWCFSQSDMRLPTIQQVINYVWYCFIELTKLNEL